MWLLLQWQYFYLPFKLKWRIQKLATSLSHSLTFTLCLSLSLSLSLLSVWQLGEMAASTGNWAQLFIHGERRSLGKPSAHSPPSISLSLCLFISFYPQRNRFKLCAFSPDMYRTMPKKEKAEESPVETWPQRPKGEFHTTLKLYLHNSVNSMQPNSGWFNMKRFVVETIVLK